MPIVRDLLISFGAELDKGQMKNVDKEVHNFGEGMKSALSMFLGIQFVNFFKSAVLGLSSMASAVVENKNVMHEAFGEYQGDIEGWAETLAKEAGRSRYELELLAGGLGALIDPMIDNKEKTAEYSAALTQLAVDLGSFYNRTDEEALGAIRSGLVGETEPLKRFGVVMSQAALDAFALEQGIHKTTKAMTEAEKMELRYQFIMSKTKNAQGDAIRTIDELANSTKALKSQLYDTAVSAGSKLLPIMKWLVSAGKGLATWLARVAEETNVVQAAFIVLGAIAAGIAIKLALPFLPLILGLTAVILVVDEFITFLKGGDSIIGRFIDWLVGPGSAAAAAEYLKQAFVNLAVWAKTSLVPALIELKNKAVEFAVKAGPYVKEFLLSIAGKTAYVWNSILKPFGRWFLDEALPAIKDFAETAAPYIKVFADVISESLGWAFDNIIKPLFNYLATDGISTTKDLAATMVDILGPALKGTVALFKDVFVWLDQVGTEINAFIDTIIRGIDSANKFLGFNTDLEAKTKPGKGLSSIFGKSKKNADEYNAGMNAMAGLPLNVNIPMSSLGLAGAASAIDNSNNPITINQPINVYVNDKKEAPGKYAAVGNAVSTAVTKSNRKTLEALTQKKR